jgi:long-chain acyl-CoA synthetase
LITLPITKYFCRLKVEGLENVETVAGPVIFIANHTSYFDAPAIFAALPRDIRLQTAVATWREFFETRSPNPLVKLWKRFMFCFAALGFNIYPFPQQKGFKRSMEHTGWLMDRNFNVLFFPEGMRTRTGKLQEFKEGIGKIVSEMKTPVIPVGIKGLFEIYPLQKNFPQAGEVTIRFGEPLPFEKFENQHQSAIAQGLAEEVRKLLD